MWTKNSHGPLIVSVLPVMAFMLLACACSQDRGQDLIRATKDGTPEEVASLLSSGANVNARDKEGHTPLMYAAMLGRLEVVQQLLDKGADVNAITRTGSTALEYAALGLDRDLAKSLHQRITNPFSRDVVGWIQKVNRRKCHLQVMKFLLEKGADPNAGSPLSTAGMKGDMEAVKLLLDAGVDPNAEEGLGLKLAVTKGEARAVHVFVEKGANERTLSEALAPAAYNGRLEAVRLLLDKGADPNFKDGQPLKSASFNGHLGVVKLLMERGADVKADSGKALANAVRGGHAGVAKLLLEAGAEIVPNQRGFFQAALIPSAKEGHTDMVKLLLDKGVDVNARFGAFQRTALMNAAEKGHEETVKILLQGGAEVNVKDKYGRTALMDADRKVLGLLLDNGADINAREREGRTALGIALDRRRKEYAEFLRAHGGTE